MTIADDFSAKAHEWLTLTDDSVTYHINDGSIIVLTLTDMGWTIEKDDTQLTDDVLPYRAGAMEWVRRYLAKNQLATVPSPAQAAAPHHDATWQDRTNPPPSPKPARLAPVPEPEPSALPDAMQFARELEAMRIAHELQAMMKPH